MSRDTSNEPPGAMGDRSPTRANAAPEQRRIASTAAAALVCVLVFAVYAGSIVVFVGSPLGSDVVGRDFFPSTIQTTAATPAPPSVVTARRQARGGGGGGTAALLSSSAARAWFECPDALCALAACVRANASDTCNPRFRRRVVRAHECAARAAQSPSPSTMRLDGVACLDDRHGLALGCRLGACRADACRVSPLATEFSCDCICRGRAR